MVDFSGAAEESWFGVSTPFHFGFPTFEVSAIIAMCIVGLVIMTETTGDILAVGEIVDKPVGAKQLADGLRADGLSTIIGGVFNTFPDTAFAQNVGLVSLTGVRSRFVAVVAISVGVGLLPTVSPTLFNQLPTGLSIVFHSGISAGAITAILLNLLLNSRAVQARQADDDGHAPHDAVRAAGSDVTMPVPDSGVNVSQSSLGDSTKSS